MNKRFVIWTFVLAAFAGLSLFLWQRQQMPAGFNRISDQDIAEVVKRLRGGTELSAPATVSPINLKWPLRLAIGGLGRGDDEQNRQLEDLVLADLTDAPGLELVERRSLVTVLRELNMDLSGLVRANDAVRVGKLLKADWFLLGTGANINGTNYLVVRLVDSRTGILREAGAFSAEGSPMNLASKITGFVRQCRQDTAAPKPRVYLAIGTFEDLSLNNRLAAFPAQLRAYLTAAYQGTNVTLLEREATDVLYQEVGLDLAGLTGQEGAQNSEPLQSAFWLVDGYYQSYETTNSEVELVLNVRRMFGLRSKEVFRGLPNEALFQKIKDEIDLKMRTNTSPIFVTRVSEARAQMFAGRELTGYLINYESGYEELDQQEYARRRRKTEEAIHAFETVLLLEPTNREAKICLAECFRDQTIARMDEARNLYHEILEEPVQDQWDHVAKQALVDSFRWSDPSEKARWFAAAIQNNTNPSLEQFYRKNAEIATRDAAIENGGPDAVNQAEKRLLEAIRSSTNVWAGKPGIDDGEFRLSEFPGAFRDKADAARAMAAFLPKLESEFPELAPHLTAAVLPYQVDTNSPVVAEYQKQLEWCLAHTNRFYHPERFWELAHGSACNWLLAHQQSALATETVDGYLATAGRNIGDMDKMASAFDYMKVGRWNFALEIFESYSNLPVLMPNYGPWGSGLTVVPTALYADDCRAKLGLPVVRDPREFLMGKACLALSHCSSFAIDETGLWIAAGNQLLRLDPDLKTNLVVNLPKDADKPITTLDIRTDKIWIGTGGDGLIEFDKGSRRCRHLTVKDGLMMEEICCTRLSRDALWIGYGYKDEPGFSTSHPGGGIGYLDLSSHQFVSFTPSLANGSDAHVQTGGNSYLEPTDQPPRRAVTAMEVGPDGDVYFVTEGRHVLRRLRSRRATWDELSQVVANSSLAVAVTNFIPDCLEVI